MNAVFCCLNSKYIHSSLAPWYLYAACKQKCTQDIHPFVVEGTINEPLENIRDRITEKNPDVVLFSCYIWNIAKTKQLCKDLKAYNPHLLTVVGGPEVSFNAQQILQENQEIGFVCAGAGENSIPQLLTAICDNTKTDIAGVSFRDGEKLVLSDKQADPDDSVSPFCEEYFAHLNGRIAYMESSRGCPFRCAFCLSGRLGNVRYMDMDRVKNEILLLGNSGTKTVKFVDRTFNCHKQRAAEILSFILENHGKTIPADVCFHFEIAADLLDETLFDIISRLPVGSVQFEVGIQSFNEATLQKINRKTDLRKVEENVRRLLSFGNCHIHTDLIAGLPEEDFDSFVDGFNRAYAMQPHMLQLGFLKILHGSDMATHKELYPCNHCSTPPYEVTDTPWISQQELQKLHTAENELERLYNSGRFRRTLAYVLRACSMTPFDLFFAFGTHIKNSSLAESCSLDDYTNAAFAFFCTLDGVDKVQLRDCMFCDRIAGNNSGRIPEALKIPDPMLKTVKRKIMQVFPVDKGTNRSVGILYSEKAAVYCDYNEKHGISGEYTLQRIPLAELETD